VAEIEERAGDESAAARDYLAAHHAHQDYREALYGLVRLLEKRRSLTILGRAIDALGASATTPDEKASALVMNAMYLADVGGDLGEAVRLAREAADTPGASAHERASAWLSLEVLAGKTGDALSRDEALRERTGHAWDPAWRALLLIDRARAAIAAGDHEAAHALLSEARSAESQATWTATTMLSDLAATALRDARPADAERLDGSAADLELALSLAIDAQVGARADALGVPRWAREPARAVDACLRAAEARRALGQLDLAASVLERGLSFSRSVEGAEGRMAEAALLRARLQIAGQAGDDVVAAELTEKLLAAESDPALAAAHAARSARYALSRGDRAAAQRSLSRAVESDPRSVLALAQQMDLLADGDDARALADQLEAVADRLFEPGAQADWFVLGAYVRGVLARDVRGARASLDEARSRGAEPAALDRVARLLAGLAGDTAWLAETTERLFAASAAANAPETASLGVELLRFRYARDAAEDARIGLRELSGSPRSAWLARALQAFLPADASEAEGGSRAREALDRLAAIEPDPDLARGFALIGAMRAQASDLAMTRRRLRDLAEAQPADVLVASYLGDLDREAGDRAAAATTAARSAAASEDPDLAGALYLQAGFDRWLDGDRKAAVDAMSAAGAGSPEAAAVALAWASWGVEPDSLAARREAIERAEQLDGDRDALALERFVTELGAGRADAAEGALTAIDPDGDGHLAVAAALGRLAWAEGGRNEGALQDAIRRIERCGPAAALVASAERVRVASQSGELDAVARGADRWFQAGGGLAAALQWLAAATAMDDHGEELRARLAIAGSLSGDSREAMLATAALVQARVRSSEPPALVAGQSAAARLVNLELAPPGCDPRRRAFVLGDLEGALGDDARVDATGLSGWALLASSEIERARAAFEHAVAARPGDLAAWEGLRECGVRVGDRALQARAAGELGSRCRDDRRAAAFSEEAALLWLDAGSEDEADRALEASFARDPSRPVAFDRMFRRVRDRRENDKLLDIIARRLGVIDDADQIQKLYWEQARVLREKGDQDGALEALGQVTLLNPDHVGALALLGEINIRRGRFEDAAESLARLAKLPSAPPKNRVTAGVAAADLFEKKLDRADDAMDVLVCLHEAGISTLPIRERLARAAARAGAWERATSVLEQLMNERPDAPGRLEAARLAMAIRRDRLGDAAGALAAIRRMLEESPADAEGVDMVLASAWADHERLPLLSAAKTALIEAVQRSPRDADQVARLSRLAAALGASSLEHAALAVLAYLRPDDAAVRQRLGRLAAGKPRTPRVALSPEVLRTILAPGDDGPLAELFMLLGPTLAEALGPNVAGCGVGRRERIDPRSGLAVRNDVAAWAGALGVQELELYVGGRDPRIVQGVPGDPPALVIGAEVQSPLAPAARARIAAELLGIARGTSVLRTRDDLSTAAIVVAACNLAEVRVEHPPYAVLAEIERQMGKAISRKVRKGIPDVCRAVAASGADARSWRRRALASQDRLAVVASGDPAAVLGEGPAAGPETGGQDGRVDELLAFVLSPEYLDARRAIGLEDES
jgi:lipopolysaccharide biosynthesis regulator YciM